MTTSPSSTHPIRRGWTWLHAKRWRRWILDVALIVAVISAITYYQTRHLVEAGDTAPNFTLPVLSSPSSTQQPLPLRLKDLRGQPVVLAFWAPWCRVCHWSSGQLSSLHQSRDDIHVVSVALSYEHPDEVRAYVDEHNVDYPVLLGTREVAQAYRINAFPTIYVLNAQGEVEHRQVGLSSSWGIQYHLLGL